MSKPIKTVRQEEQTHTLFCECHSDKAVETLYVLPGNPGEESVRVCLTTYMQFKEAS